MKEYNKDDGRFVLISLNSPAVTDINSCLYMLGFESISENSELSHITIDEGSYLIVDYAGSRDHLRDVYTWLIKYYFPEKGLKYDYHMQFHEYNEVPDLGVSEISCKIYLPVCYV